MCSNELRMTPVAGAAAVGPASLSCHIGGGAEG